MNKKHEVFYVIIGYADYKVKSFNLWIMYAFIEYKTIYSNLVIPVVKYWKPSYCSLSPFYFGDSFSPNFHRSFISFKLPPLLHQLNSDRHISCGAIPLHRGKESRCVHSSAIVYLTPASSWPLYLITVSVSGWSRKRKERRQWGAEKHGLAREPYQR